jgi:hypothetical protein
MANVVHEKITGASKITAICRNVPLHFSPLAKFFRKTQQIQWPHRRKTPITVQVGSKLVSQGESA